MRVMSAPCPGFAEPRIGVAGPPHLRFWHLPQAERLDKGQLREPEAGVFEHLCRLFGQEGPGLWRCERMPRPAVRGVFEPLRERYFERDRQAALAWRIVANALDPSPELALRIALTFVRRPNQKWHQPGAEGAGPRRPVLKHFGLVSVSRLRLLLVPAASARLP